MSIDKTNNDAILGLDVDLTHTRNNQISQDAQYQQHLQQQQNVTGAAKLKRKSDKLTPDILLSNRGIPTIFKSIKHIKFQKKPKSTHSKSINAINKIKFGNDYHYNNLTLILRIFQNWGHHLGSHLKFDRFIENLLRGMNQTDNKHWVRNLVREEMRLKMEQQIDIESNNNKGVSKHSYDDHGADDDEIPDDIHHQEPNNVENDDDQQWSELFGGRQDEEDQDQDEDMHTYQAPMFSNYLRASSQPLGGNQSLMFSQNDINDGNSHAKNDTNAKTANDRVNKSNIVGDNDDIDEDELNTLNELNESTLLQDLLMDKEDEEEEESQGGVFSQYVANDSMSQMNTQLETENVHPDSDKGKEDHENNPQSSSTQEPVADHPKPANTTIEFSDDGFSDDDDDYYNNV